MEQLLADRRRQARPAIRDFELESFGGPLHSYLDSAKGRGCGLGLHGIVEKVADSAFQELGITSKDRGLGHPKVESDGGAAERRVGYGSPHHGLEVDILEPCGPWARERQKVLQDSLKVLGLVSDFTEIVLYGLLAWPTLDECQIAAQGRQAIAQLVGDSGRELSDTGQARGQAALFLPPA